MVRGLPRWTFIFAQQKYRLPPSHPHPQIKSFNVGAIPFLPLRYFYSRETYVLLQRKLLRNGAPLAVSNCLLARGSEVSILVSRFVCTVYTTHPQNGFPSFTFRAFASGAEPTISSKVELVCRILQELSSVSEETFDWRLRNLDIVWDPGLVTMVVKRLQCPKLAYSFFVWLMEKGGYNPTHVEYNAALQKLGFAKFFKHLRMLLYRMKETKCRMSTATYTILVRSYGKAGRIHDACQALLEMNASGVGPGIQAYNGLIESFMKLGRVESACLMYKQMCQAGLMPNKFTISILVNGLCRAGKLDEAQTFLKHAPAVNTICYNSLLNGFCQAGRIYEAYNIWNEMKSKGLNSDLYTYNTLILGSCKTGLLDLALKLREDMVEKRIPPDGFTRGTLIFFLCKAEREHEAYKILTSMISEDCILNYKEYHALRLAFSKTSLYSAVERLLVQMVKF